MLDLSRIRAITIDLDDTLRPIWPTIARAEAVLADWLAQHAPATAAWLAPVEVRAALRAEVLNAAPGLRHDLGALRRESIRRALLRCAEDPQLAGPAYEVFLEHRMRVDFYADALPALEFLAQRFPLVAISNGNADLQRVGIAAHFVGALSAHAFGVGKPDPRIFHAAAQATGVAAQQVLHVGDDAALDVLAGHAAGMQTAWVNRSGQAWAHPVDPHVSVSDLRQLCALWGAGSAGPDSSACGPSLRGAA